MKQRINIFPLIVPHIGLLFRKLFRNDTTMEILCNGNNVMLWCQLYDGDQYKNLFFGSTTTFHITYICDMWERIFQL